MSTPKTIPIWPEVFLTGEIEGISKALLIAAALQAMALLYSNAPLPREDFLSHDNELSYGHTMSKITTLIGCDPTSEEAFKIAMNESSQKRSK
jgi:hypothetical protein